MKEGASQTINSTDDNTLEVIEQLQTMRTADNNVAVSLCANCGKEGANNICNKCKQVKYCNAVCKKVHKKKHKKQCESWVAELHDEKLFKQPPQEEDCPICFMRMPTLGSTGYKYYACCGKVICSGCAHAPVYDNQGNEVDNQKCPYCRTPFPKTNEEAAERERKRVELSDPIAIHNLGIHYAEGLYGLPQDHTKALELLHRAAELGHSDSYCNIGSASDNGRGVGVDETKANHYYELAAIGGNVNARYNLGINEENAGNIDRALKHYMIAIRDGNTDSLKEIQDLFSNGHATKDDYAKALQARQGYLGEIRSRQRDEAAAFDNEQFRYY